MRRHFYLAWFIIILFSTGIPSSLHAAETTNYVESFTGLNTSKHDFAPISWGHIVESVFDEDTYDDIYVSYSAMSSGGQSGAYLKGGSQILVYGSDAANDLLVTPLVKGTISFYLKKNTAGGTAKLFNCSKNGTKFTRGPEITFDIPELNTSGWTKVTLSLDEYTYLGIRLDDMCIDEFSASNANVPDVKSVEITSTKLLSPSTVYADENGIVTIHASFEIRNSGNVPLSAADYSFQMEKRTNPVLVMTPQINGSKDLAVGETATVDATCQYTLPDKTKGDRVAYDIRENLTKTTKQIYFVEVIAYIATMDIRDSKSIFLSASSVVDYETFKGERSISFTLKNTGGAPLSVTGVNLPDGFSIDNPVFTIPSQESVTKTVKLSGQAGRKEGIAEFLFEGDGTKSFNLKGNIVGADTWFEDFENGLPAGWILPTGSNWSVTSEITTNFSNKHMSNSNVSNLTSLISPKVTVKEGESLTFSIARKNQYTAPVIQLRYSKDRQNWSQIIPIETSGILPASEKGFKTVTLNTIPAGDYYLSFEAGYVCLDNVYGYRLASVDHDFFIKSLAMPASGTVNHPVSVTATLMNMTDKAEAANAFTVELTEDGKVVATAPASELGPKESKEFSLAYTPHSAGNHNLKLVLTSSGSTYSTSSSDYTIHINQEIAADEIVIGNASQTGNNVPLKLGYNHSLSETIYKKSTLGLNSGSKIIQIRYPFYSTDKDLNTAVSIWLENTSDEAPSTSTPADTAKMTKVYYAPYTFLKGGSKTELSLSDFILPEGFTYTGENLRVVVRSSATTYSSGINFGYDPSISNTSNYKYKDQIADFPGATIYTFTTGLPVIHFCISKSVPNVSGKVTADSQGIEGVQVTLTSNNIIYNGTTDEQGEYSINIFQGDKEYMLTADKIGYTVSRSKLTVAQSNLTGQDFQIEPTGANIIETGSINVTTADQSVALQGEGWTAEQIGQVSASLNGNTSITGIDMSHIDLPEGITATFDAINPSCLIYVKKDAIAPQAWKNVIKGDQSESVTLENKAPFRCIKPFMAKSISYKRTAHTAASPQQKSEPADVMETICLPYTVSQLPGGCSVKEYTGSKTGKVTFETREIQTIEANVPYLLTVAGGTALDFQASDELIIPGQPVEVENDDYSYCGTFTHIPDGADHNYYVFDGIQFLKASLTTNVPPYRGYFKVIGNPAQAPTLGIDIDGEGTTKIGQTDLAEGLSVITLPDGTVRISTPEKTSVGIYGADGRIIRSLILDSGVHAINDLPKGIYIINHQKVVVK